MSGETEADESGWTVDQLRQHYSALRAADSRFYEERDRRYTEIAIEREKALRIKERGDEVALGLARDIQTYKDVQHNGLLEQLSGERGLYATKTDVVAVVEKIEATIKPLADYVTGQQGRSQGITAGTGYLLAAILAATAILGALVAFKP